MLRTYLRWRQDASWDGWEFWPEPWLKRKLGIFVKHSTSHTVNLQDLMSEFFI